MIAKKKEVTTLREQLKTMSSADNSWPHAQDLDQVGTSWLQYHSRANVTLSRETPMSNLYAPFNCPWELSNMHVCASCATSMQQTEVKVTFWLLTDIIMADQTKSCSVITKFVQTFISFICFFFSPFHKVETDNTSSVAPLCSCKGTPFRRPAQVLLFNGKNSVLKTSLFLLIMTLSNYSCFN